MNNPRAPRFFRRPRFKRGVRGRALERGAAMVEAVIVISMLILGLMGLMFFRYFYVKELMAARLARASTLAYAMSGCDDGKRPKDWIGIKDRIDLTVSAPDADSQPAAGKDVNQPATSSNSDANGFLSGLGLTGDGRGVLNPITKTGVSGNLLQLQNGGVDQLVVNGTGLTVTNSASIGTGLTVVSGGAAITGASSVTYSGVSGNGLNLAISNTATTSGTPRCRRPTNWTRS